MGFFDKLLSTVNTVKDTVNAKMEAAAAEQAARNNPFVDPVVEQYFDVLSGMAACFFIENFEAEHKPKARLYISHWLKCECDDAKLQTAMDLYNRGREKKMSTQYDITLTKHWENSYVSDKYRCDFLEGTQLFYPEQIENAELELEHILDVIKNNIDCRHFAQGMSKIEANSSIKHHVISNAIIAKNPVILEYVFQYFTENYTNRAKSGGKIIFPLAHMALITSHFETYGGDPSSYPPISDEEYRDFICNTAAFKKIVDDNPFAKEEEIHRLRGHIEKASVLDHKSASYYKNNGLFDSQYYLGFSTTYALHAACHHVCKQISNIQQWTLEGVDVTGTTNAPTLFALLVTYFK